MARSYILEFIAAQVREKFPDIKYRKTAPPGSSYAGKLKCPGRPFEGDEIIDRDLYIQAKNIIAAQKNKEFA